MLIKFVQIKIQCTKFKPSKAQTLKIKQHKVSYYTIKHFSRCKEMKFGTHQSHGRQSPWFLSCFTVTNVTGG